MRLRRGFTWLLDHPWLALVPLVIVGFIGWVVSTRTQPYHVQVEFSSAFNLVSGLPVDIDGEQAGMVSGVRYVNDGSDGGAVVTIGISSKQYQPLHEGTTVQSRWGSTIGNGTRRLDVNPGPASAPEIPNNGIIQQADSTPAVDLDQVLDVLTPNRRAALTKMLENLKPALAGEAPNIHAALANAPAAFTAAQGVLGDLASNTYALTHLISNGDKLTATLAADAPEISQLVNGAGQTFATLGSHASGLDASLEYAPAALTEAKTTLGQLDHSVNILSSLVTDIKPGAAQLSPLAKAMTPTLDNLYDLVPTADATLKQATSSAPEIRLLLNNATPLMTQLGTASTSLAPILDCIRPYAPELGSAVEDAAEWMETYIRVPPGNDLGVEYQGPPDPVVPGDIDQHGVRAMPEASLASDHADVGVSTATFVKLAGKDYAEPRPPGLSVGQPWYLPQCGAGPNSTNPADDPENPVGETK